MVGALDIAVGRLTVKNLDEAKNVVDKIIEYDGPQYGDWRIRNAWVADDQDGGIHLNQNESMVTVAEREAGFINHNKIYFDAFPQVATPGGARYPQVTEAIDDQFDKGVLVLNYFGHGGPKGWAQERVLQLSDIQNWNNPGQYPLLITATCTFTAYDDPEIVSGGEEAFLRERSGAIALYSTVRPGYRPDNRRLVDAVFNEIYR